VLKDELQELDMSASELARQIGVPVNRITEIMKGRRNITGDTAVRLGHWFGMAPQFWMNLQAEFDIRVARANLGEELEKLPSRRAA
jgi:addiction module HigA family antidote